MNCLKISFLIALVSVVAFSCKKEEPKKEVEVEVKCDCEGEVFNTFNDLRATHLYDNLFALHINGQRVYGIRCLENATQVIPQGDYQVSGGYKQRCSSGDENLRTNNSAVPFLDFTSMEKIE